MVICGVTRISIVDHFCAILTIEIGLEVGDFSLICSISRELMVLHLSLFLG